MNSILTTAQIRMLMLSPAGRRVTVCLAPVARIPLPDGRVRKVCTLSLPALEFVAMDLRLGDTVGLGLTPGGRTAILGPVLEHRPHWAAPFAPARQALIDQHSERCARFREACHA
ncbi:hypothetical protein [uncultured Desulfovibrio sp.]|uniref:hypothetical protein n=1 Tax=uncultured Desulfovibrio sp. TaxID=167968 RepID=UPI002711F6E5|nr:hypothetical protein [uncultured Desulfovibrio sp.]